MTKPRHIATINLDHPDFFSGATVIQREPATVMHPVMRNGGYVSPVIDEVLLNNEKVEYQCRKCGRVFESAISGAAHQKAHSAASELKDAKKKIDELEQQKSTQRPATRATRKRTTMPKVAKASDGSIVKNSRSSHRNRIAVTPQWKSIIQRLSVIQSNLEAVMTDVIELANQEYAAGDLKTLREKAAKYDAMKEAFK